jgi:aspartate aminotransferase-like enzyme
MIAARGKRPFSLDQKLDDLDRYLPLHTSVCEFRLLAIRPRYRGGQILPGLMSLLDTWCRDHGHDLGIISGTTRQQRLYAHLGFTPFGPLTGSGDARFQPMYLTIDDADRAARPLLRLARVAKPPVSFLPGPVEVTAATQAAFVAPPIPHRGEAFARLMTDVRQRLQALTGAAQVLVLNGSGTTANDVVALRLRSLDGHGIVLANGEFGERLGDHARRAGLSFTTIVTDWGTPFDAAAVHVAVARVRPSWIWAVHVETSTGMCNDIAWLGALAHHHGARLALDCIGSIGTLPLDLRTVFAASGTSGKGLASYAGLALVFLDHRPAPDASLPRSLDAGLIADCEGIAFTIPSSPLAALQASLQGFAPDERYAEIEASGAAVRQALDDAGIAILAPADHASPAVVTIVAPPDRPASLMGARMRDHGFLLAYESAYLRKRNWLQICLMGEVSRDRIDEMLTSFTDLFADEWEYVASAR